MTIFVDNFVCEDTKLLINTSNPSKPPLEFAIRDLKMQDIGPGLPMKFNATLVNPKPVGDIQSAGLLDRGSKKLLVILLCKATIPSATPI